MSDRPLLTTSQLAKYLGVPVATIHRWRYVGSGPPAIKIGRHLRFDPIDIAMWIESRKSSDAQRENGGPSKNRRPVSTIRPQAESQSGERYNRRPASR